MYVRIYIYIYIYILKKKTQWLQYIVTLSLGWKKLSRSLKTPQDSTKCTSRVPFWSFIRVHEVKLILGTDIVLRCSKFIMACMAVNVICPGWPKTVKLILFSVPRATLVPRPSLRSQSESARVLRHVFLQWRPRSGGKVLEDLWCADVILEPDYGRGSRPTLNCGWRLLSVKPTSRSYMISCVII